MNKLVAFVTALVLLAGCSAESTPSTPIARHDAVHRSRDALSTKLGLPYDPPGGTQPFFTAFAGDPLEKTIPSAPAISPQSGAWTSAIAALGPFAFDAFSAYGASASPSNRRPYDLSWPIYLNDQGSATPVTIHCLLNTDYGAPCNVEGESVSIDDAEVPQNGGCPTASPSGTVPDCSYDAHWGLVDPASGNEYWLWQARWPPVNGVLTVSYGGRCALDGDGFTASNDSGPAYTKGCVGDAAGVPGSLGFVRVSDVVSAIALPDGVLPGAITASFGCPGTSNGTLPAPFIGPGDGLCANLPTEGTRFFLAMTDAQVDALGLPPLSDVILRTMDEQHYGAVWVDNGGGSPSNQSPQLSLEVESDSTYTAWGLPGPLYSTLYPLALSEGIATYPIAGGVAIPIPVPANFSWKNFAFCATSSC